MGEARDRRGAPETRIENVRPEISFRETRQAARAEKQDEEKTIVEINGARPHPNGYRCAADAFAPPTAVILGVRSKTGFA